MTTTTWNLQAPPGFQGMREDRPLRVYWRHLPHWRQDGASYFVTFRLEDSLPQSKLRELEAIKHQWASQHGMADADCRPVPPRNISRKHCEALTRALMIKVEGWLDEGMGKCWLARPEIGSLVAQALHYLDGDQYELDCYAVMPNHVHAVVRPLHSDRWPLEKILQSRKRRTSREINALVGRSGPLWQEESFDRIIRDEEHLYRCIQYIGSNPAKARIPPDRWQRWLRPAWKSLGWNFNDQP